MTDRELLELAARAAGLEFDPTVQNKFGLLVVTEDAACQSNQKLWNPLTDDGDALRLAVKLQIGVQSYPIFQYSHAGTETLTTSIIVKEPHNNDPYAATRRAIVRAAAEIGKEKNK
jgi:hypothetical protein